MKPIIMNMTKINEIGIGQVALEVVHDIYRPNVNVT